MNSKEIILSKQELWAKSKNIQLVGSQTTRGRKIYCKNLQDNFFEPISNEVKEMFMKADGGELICKGNAKSKMNALHSSSAIGVNVFHYWMNKDVSKIASACGFCNKSNNISESIEFEKKYPIDTVFGKSPNIDIVIENKSDSKIKAFAIECKFTEAYPAHNQNGIKEKYLSSDIWKGLPNLKKLAEKISPEDKDNYHLHRAQLIKHILGLKKEYEKKSSFKLLYLWYDAFGEDGKNHRIEVEKFTKVAENDNINFISMTYQELIIKLYKNHYQDHKAYIDYLAARYL